VSRDVSNYTAIQLLASRQKAIRPELFERAISIALSNDDSHARTVCPELMRD
jgi:hypothetical protein